MELQELSEDLPDLPSTNSVMVEPARKTVDQIMSEANPMKSAKFYEVCWDKFSEWRAETYGAAINAPTEQEYITYFHHLKEVKKYQSSTLWSTFSKLNSVHQVGY